MHRKQILKFSFYKQKSSTLSTCYLHSRALASLVAIETDCLNGLAAMPLDVCFIR